MPGLLPGGELLRLDVAPDMIAAARVLAGRVVLMDWDWETVAVTHPDRELTGACCIGGATITAATTGMVV